MHIAYKMKFLNYMYLFLSNYAEKELHNYPYNFGKNYPIIDYNNTFDIETGLYHKTLIIEYYKPYANFE